MLTTPLPPAAITFSTHSDTLSNSIGAASRFLARIESGLLAALFVGRRADGEVAENVFGFEFGERISILRSRGVRSEKRNDRQCGRGKCATPRVPGLKYRHRCRMQRAHSRAALGGADECLLSLDIVKKKAKYLCILEQFYTSAC